MNVMWGHVTISFFLLVLTNCTFHRPAPEKPLRTATANTLLQKLEKKELAIGTLKALFRATMHGEGIPMFSRIDGVFLYQRPDMIRLKGFTRFGTRVFDFLLKGEWYVLNLPGEPSVSSGTVGELHLSGGSALPLELSLRAMEVLLGKIRNNPADRVAFVEDGDRYRFDVHAPTNQENGHMRSRLTRQVWVDRRHFQVNHVEYLSAKGEPIFTIHAENFRRVKDASLVESVTIVLPFHLEAEDRQEQRSVSLQFHEIVANAILEPQEFGLTNVEHRQDLVVGE